MSHTHALAGTACRNAKCAFIQAHKLARTIHKHANAHALAGTVRRNDEYTFIHAHAVKRTVCRETIHQHANAHSLAETAGRNAKFTFIHAHEHWQRLNAERLRRDTTERLYMPMRTHWRGLHAETTNAH